VQTHRRPVTLLFATSGHSGVDRVVANLLPELLDFGLSLELLTIGGHGPVVETPPADGLTVHRLPVSTKKLVLFPLIKYLRQRRPQALLTANHPLNRAALLARRVSGCPVRLSIRMGMSLSAQQAALGSRRAIRLYRSMRRWYPGADAVIAPSQGVGEDLVRIAGVDPQRLHVIRNPIINQAFHVASNTPLEHPWFSPGGVPVIVAAGSLEPRKDFSTLLRAFSALRQDLECKLVLLGEGKEREELQALATELGISSDVDFVGHVENPYPYMKQAAVFALSSRREGASAVIVEALACGTPVVSTDCPSGPGEILAPLGDRALVAVGDHEALANALGSMLEKPPGAERLIALTREHEASLAARRYLNAMLGDEGPAQR